MTQAQLDTRIPMMGQGPRIMENMLAGTEVAARVQSLRDKATRQNMLREHGPGILSGNQSALNALATIDPGMAVGIQQRNQSMAIDRERLDMIRNRTAHEIANVQSRQEQEADREQFRNLAIKAKTAYGNPQTWQQVVAEMGIPELPMAQESFQIIGAMGQGIDDFFDSMAEGGRSNTSAAELKIARLEEVGIPRETAILIADGVLKTSRDPVSGQAQMVDARTGQPWQGQQMAEAQLSDTVADGQRQNLSFGATVPDVSYSGAFGGEGVATNLMNAGADALGIDLPFPENQEASTALRNLGLRTKTFMQQAFPGRASVQLMQELEKITAQPNQLFTGEQRGRDTLEQTASMIEALIIQQDRVLKRPRNYSPRQKADAQANKDALEGLLADYQAVIGNMSAPGQATEGGVQWRIIE
ncbi:MAG: hypothetical protein AAGA38_03000 [Pseudomonadota bacterium]